MFFSQFTGSPKGFLVSVLPASWRSRITSEYLQKEDGVLVIINLLIRCLYVHSGNFRMNPGLGKHTGWRCLPMWPEIWATFSFSRPCFSRVRSAIISSGRPSSTHRLHSLTLCSNHTLIEGPGNHNYSLNVRLIRRCVP